MNITTRAGGAVLNDVKADTKLTLAAAAAAMFALVPVSTSMAEETVKCIGGNTCKGT